VLDCAEGFVSLLVVCVLKQQQHPAQLFYEHRYWVIVARCIVCVFYVWVNVCVCVQSLLCTHITHMPHGDSYIIILL
jgi:hypothetical protein